MAKQDYITTHNLVILNIKVIVLTSSVGFSAIPTSTTLLGNMLALTATSASANAGQEQTVRTHW